MRNKNKIIEEPFEEAFDTCSFVDAIGRELNTCDDMPVTYCKKCKKFYVLDREGNREEISLKVQKVVKYGH